jgi:hypothetical protein
MNRTYDRMKQFTTWPGMKQELEIYISVIFIKEIRLHRIRLGCQ